MIVAAIQDQRSEDLNPPESKISICGWNDNNMIDEQAYPDFNDEDDTLCLRSRGGAMASKDVRIVIRPSAAGFLLQSIGWGTAYQRGDVEKAGILLGRYHRDCSDGTVVWADVTAVVSADEALVQASFETINISMEAWRKMYDQASELYGGNVQILGWYHTHLHTISTRFSHVDRATQRQSFTYPYSFGVVLNPNQKRWSVFYGPEGRECEGILLLDSTTESYRPLQIAIKQVNGDSMLQEDESIVHLDEDGQPIQESAPSFGRMQGSLVDKRSIAQRIGQALSDVGQKLQKHDSLRKRGQAPARQADPPTPGRLSICVRGARSQLSRTPLSRQFSFEYYSFSGGSECTVHPHFVCGIDSESLETILDSLADEPLWGHIRQYDNGMELTLTADELGANARIIRSTGISNQDRMLIVAQGQLRVCPERIRFIIFANEEGSHVVNMKIVHFSRGNVI